MAGYMNQVKKQAKQISTDRLIKALGLEAYKKLMAEVDEKAPKRKHLIDDSPLTKEENALLMSCLKGNTWRAIGKVLKKTAPQTMFANLAFRKLKHSSLYQKT